MYYIMSSIISMRLRYASYWILFHGEIPWGNQSLEAWFHFFFNNKLCKSCLIKRFIYGSYNWIDLCGISVKLFWIDKLYSVPFISKIYIYKYFWRESGSNNFNQHKKLYNSISVSQFFLWLGTPKPWINLWAH